MLRETFKQLISNYTDNEALMSDLWAEIESKYSSRKRHYHTLRHLENLLLELREVKNKIEKWDTILFTLFYHDVVYNVLKSNNEEKSAEFAEKRMNKIPEKHRRRHELF